MTPADMFFLIGGVLLIVAIGGAVMDIWMGPDKDLEGWDPTEQNLRKWRDR
jgi:hypothetical protein